MRLSIVCSISLVVALLSQSFLGGQESPPNRDGDFELSYSIGLGLGGMQGGVNYALKDAHDVRYDTMSMLGQREIREAIGISEDEFSNLARQHAESIRELSSLDMVLDEDARARAKEIFLAAEADVRSQLSEKQLSMLNLSRLRKGVEAVGAEYVSDPKVAELLGLSSDEAEHVAKMTPEFVDSLKAKYADLIRQSNEKLLESLTSEQQAKADELLGDKRKDEFLNQVLFKSRKPSCKQRTHFRNRMFYYVRTQKIQEKLSLTDEQVDQIGLLKRKNLESEGFPFRQLDNSQFLILSQLVVRRELGERGTVEMLAGGNFGQLLGLSDDQIKAAFELGRNLNEQLEQVREELGLQLLTEGSDLTETQAKVAAKIMSILSGPRTNGS